MGQWTRYMVRVCQWCALGSVEPTEILVNAIDAVATRWTAESRDGARCAWYRLVRCDGPMALKAGIQRVMRVDGRGRHQCRQTCIVVPRCNFVARGKVIDVPL